MSVVLCDTSKFLQSSPLNAHRKWKFVDQSIASSAACRFTHLNMHMHMHTHPHRYLVEWGDRWIYTTTQLCVRSENFLATLSFNLAWASLPPPRPCCSHKMRYVYVERIRSHFHIYNSIQPFLHMKIWTCTHTAHPIEHTEAFILTYSMCNEFIMQHSW